jgi:hypothetical protein
MMEIDAKVVITDSPYMGPHFETGKTGVVKKITPAGWIEVALDDGHKDLEGHNWLFGENEIKEVK